NTLSGMVESTSCCISEHSLEHAMSGIYPKLPHGAGLIMLSEAYFSHFAEVCKDRYAKMAAAMGGTDFVAELLKLQTACGVRDLKMSDYGMRESDLETIAAHARDTMGFLFELDPAPVSEADTLAILKKAYK
ncbi:iron-containing alcohol dehydrogenase, partial [Pontiella sp.]